VLLKQRVEEKIMQGQNFNACRARLNQKYVHWDEKEIIDVVSSTSKKSTDLRH